MRSNFRSLKDICESENRLKNGTTQKGRTREVSSRYTSPTHNIPKRCSSPNASRTSSSASTAPANKRPVSAERRHPSSPSRPTTPVRETDVGPLLASNKTGGSKLPDYLWPSTIRNLNSSFQSDKSETVPRSPSSDRPLRPPSNVARPVEVRMPMPERKRSPLKGRISVNQSENSEPVDGLRHQWPSRASGKTPTNSLMKTVVTLDKKSKISSLSRTRMVPTVTPPIRRLSLDGTTSKPMNKTASDLLMLISRDESRAEGLSGNSVDDRWLRMQRPSSSSSDRNLSLSVSGSRPSSPLVSRGVSPSRARPVGPGTRASSPARVRPSSPLGNNRQSSGSVLSFITDIKKGKKANSNFEDAHQLKLLYNRHSQWRFANARAFSLLHSQKAKVEKMLYRVWRMIVDLWGVIREKRSEVQQWKLKLKLYSVLDSQTIFLEDWTSLEKDHTDSLTRAIQDLEASILRIPVSGGARVDVKTLNEAVCSAVDVMSSMGSSLWSILPEVEGMNWLVLELADVAARQRAMLDECESLLGSLAALQVEEDSLRTHIILMRRTLKKGKQSTFG